MNTNSKYNIHFNSFKLTELNFATNKDYLKKEDNPKSIEMAPEISAGFFLNEKKNCTVFLEVKVSDSNAPFSFLIKGEAQFKFENEIDDQVELNKIVHVNLLAIIYPFIREPIAEITRKMGFTPLLLPPINFVEIFNNISKNEIKKAV
ncbi:MAG: protein translocase subunit secB [Fibrobacteres bacterium]|nr:protein translocase subunit secB [Fibrobacterota bacterium]